MARLADEILSFEENTSTLEMSRFPTNPNHCCIYRVPDRIRKINPEAYTPQLVVLGPLHHSLKAQASERRSEDIKNAKLMGYLSMEQHKKMYLSAFAQNFDGEDTIAVFRSVIKEEEEAIRASYSESTAWIESEDFVEMILHDAVFIVEFILRNFQRVRSSENTGDSLIDQVSVNSSVCEDLMLLENQLPYFILQKLFDPFITTLYQNLTLSKVIIQYFGFMGKINDNSEFKHFTDLFRCARVGLLWLEEPLVQKYQHIKSRYSAHKLHTAGIKFKVIKEELSLDVKFENGYLEVPIFEVDDRKETILRNIMALEQCHYPDKAYVCSFIFFLDYLIDTVEDVNILVEKGIIKNRIGNHAVAAMVNKLPLGIVDCNSSYYDHIAYKIIVHCENPKKKSRALLRLMYFKDPWTTRATIAATILLLLTLIQTITSIMQVLQKN